MVSTPVRPEELQKCCTPTDKDTQIARSNALKTRNGVQVQGPELRFCGADEARTRDPRRDRPVF